MGRRNIYSMLMDLGQFEMIPVGSQRRVPLGEGGANLPFLIVLDYDRGGSFCVPP